MHARLRRHGVGALLRGLLLLLLEVGLVLEGLLLVGGHGVGLGAGLVARDVLGDGGRHGGGRGGVLFLG